MVKKMCGIKKFPCALIVVTLVLCSLQGRADAELKYIGVKVGEPAPDFSLETLDGETVQLSSFEGEKIVLIDFWATWCGICKKELSKINENYRKFRGEDFEVLSVVLGGADPDRVLKVKEDKKLEFPILIDSKEQASSLYGIEGPIPVVVVIDFKGIVRFSHFGGFPVGEDEIPYVIEALLEERRQESE